MVKMDFTELDKFIKDFNNFSKDLETLDGMSFEVEVGDNENEEKMTAEAVNEKVKQLFKKHLG